MFKKFKLITVHTARRSFATNAHIAGMSSLNIMRMTGHKSEVVFLKYIKTSQQENAINMMNHKFFK